jgi:hypothetical protein
MNTYKKAKYENYFIQSCKSKNEKKNENEIEKNITADITLNTVSQLSDDDIENINIKTMESSRYNDDNDEALYVYHYPNLMMNRYGKWLDTNIVYPDGPDNCVVEFEWYYDTENGGVLQEYIDECIEQSEKIQIEDIWLCERVQKVQNYTCVYVFEYICTYICV